MVKRDHRRGRDAADHVAAPSRSADPFRRHLEASGLVLAAIVLLVGCRPIGTVDLWWELSRGREVVSGEWAPSRSLLSEETLADADWLGGLPVLLAYQMAGVSGWMLMRLAATAAVGWMAWRQVDGNGWRRLLMAGGVLLAVSPALDPSVLLWDLAGLLTLGLLTEFWHRGRWWHGLAAVACWMAVWANLGPRPAIGLLALVGWAAPWFHSRSIRTRGQYAALLVAAAAACLLTPRFTGTLTDSIRLTFPGWTAEGAWLTEGPWAPVAADFPRPQFLGFLLVTAVVLIRSAREGRGAVSLYGLALAQFVAWQNVGNMALGAVLLAMASERTAISSTVVEPAAVPTGSARRRWAALGGAAGVAVLTVAVWLQAASGVGWGLSEELDIRFLDRALEGNRLEGTALANRISTAGMVAWGGRGLVVQDVPHRALLGGRLRDLRLLLNDLRIGFRAAYQRTDGSQGGWWLPLMNRDTVLLLVAAEDVRLLEGLHPTLWRPLAIDGPVIPFAQAGHPLLTAGMVEVLRQQDYVETGDWEYQPPRSTHSEYDRDWWGFRPVQDDASVTLRQARVFRAMGLPRAALRVLRHLQHTDRADAAWGLIGSCQADLLDREIRLAGRPSEFRSLAWEATGGGSMARSDSPLARAAAAYVEGNLREALEEIGDDPAPESRYARAVLLLENGRGEESLRELRGLYNESPEEAVGILARALAALLAPEAGVEQGSPGTGED